MPKFRSDLSVHLKDIAEKQVPAKLKPIVAEILQCLHGNSDKGFPISHQTRQLVSTVVRGAVERGLRLRRGAGLLARFVLDRREQRTLFGGHVSEPAGSGVMLSE